MLSCGGRTGENTKACNDYTHSKLKCKAFCLSCFSVIRRVCGRSCTVRYHVKRKQLCVQYINNRVDTIKVQVFQRHNEWKHAYVVGMDYVHMYTTCRINTGGLIFIVTVNDDIYMFKNCILKCKNVICCGRTWMFQCSRNTDAVGRNCSCV